MAARISGDGAGGNDVGGSDVEVIAVALTIDCISPFSIVVVVNVVVSGATTAGAE